MECFHYSTSLPLLQLLLRRHIKPLHAVGSGQPLAHTIKDCPSGPQAAALACRSPARAKPTPSGFPAIFLLLLSLLQTLHRSPLSQSWGTPEIPPQPQPACTCLLPAKSTALCGISPACSQLAPSLLPACSQLAPSLLPACSQLAPTGQASPTSPNPLPGEALTPL